MIILYKNAARVNFFVDVKIHCMGGLKQDVQGTSKVVPFNCAAPEVPCTAKLRELNNK
jgi:hypothetical protein